MARVWIPAIARKLTNGKRVISASGSTVSDLLKNIDKTYPGLRDLLVENELLRPGICISIDGTITGRKLHQKIQENSEIHFIPAIFGG